jgi:hypothetical protein
MLGRLYITTRIESPNSSRVHSAMFASGNWDPSLRVVLDRFRERLANFQDALGGTIELRRLTPEETFRDLILYVTGRDLPAAVPNGPVRLNELIACERFMVAWRLVSASSIFGPYALLAIPHKRHPDARGVLLRAPRLPHDLDTLHHA